MPWGSLRTRAGALLFSGFAFSSALALGFAFALPLTLGFSTLAGAARRTRFGAGAFSSPSGDARFVARERGGAGSATLAARVRLGGMVGGGGGWWGKEVKERRRAVAEAEAETDCKPIGTGERRKS